MKRTELRRSTGEARLTVSVPVKRKCAACKSEYLRMRPMQRACSPACAQSMATAARLKKEQAQAIAETRAQRERLKPRSKWMAEAQAAFNAWIRWRDASQPCVSCGRHHDGAYDAGHYLTTGARPELRFDEENVHKQCVPCNRHLHGNTVLFRLELLRRIGQAAVDRLEGPHPPRKYAIDELRAIRDTYRTRVRLMKSAAR